MTEPIVTVILSTYNAEKHLGECLESIANQRFEEFVVHIIDDGSEDHTLEIIQHWCARDHRFRLIAVRERNRGLTPNLNELLNSANTEFIARMDADDVMLPHRLETQVRFLAEHEEVGVVGSWAYEFDEQGQIGVIRGVPTAADDIRGIVLKVNPMIHPTVMFRRNAIMGIGGYDESYTFAQDYALWFSCLGAGLKLANVPEPLIYYRVSGNHAAKRGMKYRKLDARIRWRGARKLGFGWTQSIIAAAIPLILGMMPRWMRKQALKHKNLFDPRQQWGQLAEKRSE